MLAGVVLRLGSSRLRLNVVHAVCKRSRPARHLDASDSRLRHERVGKRREDRLVQRQVAEVRVRDKVDDRSRVVSAEDADTGDASRCSVSLSRYQMRMHEPADARAPLWRSLDAVRKQDRLEAREARAQVCRACEGQVALHERLAHAEEHGRLLETEALLAAERTHAQSQAQLARL